VTTVRQDRKIAATGSGRQRRASAVVVASAQVRGAEASADTRALVEARARQDPAFAARLRAASEVAATAVPATAAPTDVQLVALKRTREYLRLRTIFTAAGILFTLLPLVFTFDAHGAQFLILGRHPGLVWSFWSLAAASWTASYVMARAVRQVGL
jgi:hypothetical protein